MPSRVNVYLPDALAEAVREADIPISAVCQAALEQEVRKVQAAREAGSDLEQVAARLKQTRADREQRDYQDGYELGMRWAKERATEAELMWATDLAGEHWISLRIEGGHSLLDFIAEENYLEEFGPPDGPGPGEYLHTERTPWMVGILEGAAKVYEQVMPLL